MSLPTTDKELESYIKKLPRVEFKNEHGEKFVLHSNGITVLMSGDEVDMMVAGEKKMAGKYIMLFHPAFSIWSKSELYQLGLALVELHKDMK